MLTLNLGLTLLMILISVAFFTLLERKTLGYIHIRYGPNKVGPLGLFQPLSDALKLFLKENYILYFGMFYFYWLMPSLGLFLMLIIWLVVPFGGGGVYLKWGLVCFVCVISLVVYYLMLSGWCGSSKYGMLGSYRSSAQSISYEVVLIFLLLIVLIYSGGYYLDNFCYYGLQMDYVLIFGVILMIWLFTMLAENMRAPFDFSEGESELVSGFNTEYGGGLFSLVFISEYGFMLFFSMLTVYLFLSMSYFFIKILLLCFFYIWVRGSFPRLRYDKFMIMNWKFILPILLSLFSVLFLLNL